MRGRHHASSETTVTYKPKADIQPGGTGGGPVDLAYSANCHFCNVTHISVIRPFPIPYRCSTCAAKQLELPPPPVERPEPTPAQAVALAEIEKAAECIGKLNDDLVAETGRRDALLVKARALGLSTRRLGKVAQLTSPGVVSAVARARHKDPALPRELAQRPRMDAVLAVLADGPRQWNEIRDSLGITSKHMGTLITRMLDHGEIERIAHGTYRRVPTKEEA